VVLLCACGNAPVEAESEYEKEEIPEEIITYEEPEEAGEPPSYVYDPSLYIYTPPESEPREVFEWRVLEPLIVIGKGWDIFTSNYIISVVSTCGAVKNMEYEFENAEDFYVPLDMYRFATIIYEQMNDESIPVVAEYDKTPDRIIEISNIIDTFVDLGSSDAPYHPGNRKDYYIITGTDTYKRAVRIGCGLYPCYTTNEVAGQIHEYFETTTGRLIN
jgi:hypothetical protein